MLQKCKNITDTNVTKMLQRKKGKLQLNILKELKCHRIKREMSRIWTFFKLKNIYN